MEEASARGLLDADVALGTALPAFSMKYTTDMFKLGDVKTLHNDYEAARLEGLPRPVAVAPQVAALVFRMMTASFGGGWIVGGKGSLTFRRPVWSDDFATSGGTVTGKFLEGDRVRVQCDVWVQRQDGERAVVGTCSALVPARSA
jgi:acyl dehydratase